MSTEVTDIIAAIVAVWAMVIITALTFIAWQYWRDDHRDAVDK